MARTEIGDKQLSQVSGGNITFTPNKNDPTKGKLGINGRESYHYENDLAVIDFISEHMFDKEFKTVLEQDEYLIDLLLKENLIK